MTRNKRLWVFDASAIATLNKEKWTLLPGRFTRFWSIRHNMEQAAIIMNYDLIAAGLSSETDFIRKIIDLAAEIGYQGVRIANGREVQWFGLVGLFNLYVHVCYNHPESTDTILRDPIRRKPNPLMLFEALQICGLKPESSSDRNFAALISNCGLDKQTAQITGIQYLHPDEFFPADVPSEIYDSQLLLDSRR